MKNKIKNMKGITLVALIITIIVLLILASVVINMTLGNDGIINKTQGAVDMYKNAQEQEEAMLNQVVGHMNTDGIVYEGNGSGNNNLNANKYDKNIYDNWDTWLKLGGVENPSQYNGVNIFNDSELMAQVMSNREALVYLKNSNVILFPAVLNNKIAKNQLKQNLTSIPQMTSNTTPSGEASASQTSTVDQNSYEPYGALSGYWTDENINRYGTNENEYDRPGREWSTPNNITNYPTWLQYKFADNTKITPVLFEYISNYAWGYGADHSIKIQGSNNGTTWTDLTDVINCKAFKKYEIQPTKNIAEYQYFRLNVLSRTETYGSRTDVLKFQVYGI